jgi:hypothetical protein
MHKMFEFVLVILGMSIVRVRNISMAKVSETARILKLGFN